MTAIIQNPSWQGGKPHPGRGFPCFLPPLGHSPSGCQGRCCSQRRLCGRWDRRVWRLLPFPTLPSTGRPLFQAQAGCETTTVPSGLLWIKWEHCMEGTGRMEPAPPEQSWALASPSLKAFQAGMEPHKHPAYLRCWRGGLVCQRFPSCGMQTIFGWYPEHTHLERHHQPVSRQRESDQSSLAKACILNWDLKGIKIIRLIWEWCLYYFLCSLQTDN